MPLIHAQQHMLGTPRARDGGLLGEALGRLGLDKTAAATEIVDETTVQKMAYDMGISITRVAGNVYEQPATRDFWAVRNGKLVRLTGADSSVDDGEKLAAADIDDPERTLHSILADLEF